MQFGLFHGDPHPGNVFALRDGRIAYVDFGNVAEVTPPFLVQVHMVPVHAAGADKPRYGFHLVSCYRARPVDSRCTCAGRSAPRAHATGCIPCKVARSRSAASEPARRPRVQRPDHVWLQVSQTNKQTLIDAVVHAVNEDYEEMAKDFIKLVRCRSDACAADRMHPILSTGHALEASKQGGAMRCPACHLSGFSVHAWRTCRPAAWVPGCLHGRSGACRGHPHCWSMLASEQAGKAWLGSGWVRCHGCAVHAQGFLEAGTDIRPIVPALEKIWADSMGRSLSDFNFRTVTSKFNELVYQYPIHIPERYALVIRRALPRPTSPAAVSAVRVVSTRESDLASALVHRLCCCQHRTFCADSRRSMRPQHERLYRGCSTSLTGQLQGCGVPQQNKS